eukprot:gene748-9000_t
MDSFEIDQFESPVRKKLKTDLDNKFTLHQFYDKRIRLNKANTKGSVQQDLIWILSGNFVNVFSVGGKDGKDFFYQFTAPISKGELLVSFVLVDSTPGIIFISDEGEFKYWPNIFDSENFIENTLDLKTNSKVINLSNSSKNKIFISTTDNQIHKLILSITGVEQEIMDTTQTGWLSFNWFSSTTKQENENIKTLFVDEEEQILYILKERNLQMLKVESNKIHKEINLIETFQLDEKELIITPIDISVDNSIIYVVFSLLERTKTISTIPSLYFQLFEYSIIDDNVVQHEPVQKSKNDYNPKDLNCKLFTDSSNAVLLWDDLMIKNSKEKIKIDKSFGGGFHGRKFHILTSKGVQREQDDENYKPYIATDKSSFSHHNVAQIFEFFCQHNYLPNFNVSNLSNESIVNYATLIVDLKQHGFILGQLKEKKQKFEVFLNFLNELNIWSNFDLDSILNLYSKLIFATALRDICASLYVKNTIKEAIKFCYPNESKENAEELFFSKVSKIEEIIYHLGRSEYDLSSTNKIYQILVINKEEFFHNYVKFEIPKKEKDILWWHEELRNYVLYQIEANHQYYQQTNDEIIFELTMFLFECYEKELSKKPNNILIREYESNRHKLIENIKNRESQLTLSIKFKEFKKIIELCEFDKEKLTEYIELFYMDNFFTILFGEFKKLGRNHELLEIGKEYPNEFSQLIQNDLELKWKFSIQNDEFKQATNSLEVLIKNEHSDFDKKRNLSAISKLCCIVENIPFQSKEVSTIKLQNEMLKLKILKDSKCYSADDLISFFIEDYPTLFKNEEAKKNLLNLSFDVYNQFSSNSIILEELWSIAFQNSNEFMDDDFNSEFDFERIRASEFFRLYSRNMKQTGRLTEKIFDSLTKKFVKNSKTLDEMAKLIKF